jgi:hypothetical protein
MPVDSTVPLSSAWVQAKQLSEFFVLWAGKRLCQDVGGGDIVERNVLAFNWSTGVMELNIDVF